MINVRSDETCSYIQNGDSLLQAPPLHDVEQRPLDQELGLHLHISTCLRLLQTLHAVLTALRQLRQNLVVWSCPQQHHQQLTCQLRMPLPSSALIYSSDDAQPAPSASGPWALPTATPPTVNMFPTHASAFFIPSTQCCWHSAGTWFSSPAHSNVTNS